MIEKQHFIKGTMTKKARNALMTSKTRFCFWKIPVFFRRVNTSNLSMKSLFFIKKWGLFISLYNKIEIRGKRLTNSFIMYILIYKLHSLCMIFPHSFFRILNTTVFFGKLY